MSALTNEERAVLKLLFSKKWPEARTAMDSPNSRYHAYAETLWLGFKEGYILGRSGIKVEVR